MQQLQNGTILQGGKYRIERVLGQGGFGNTYFGYNTIFNEPVAIKEFFMQGINDRKSSNGSVSVSIEGNRPQFEEQREKFKKEALRIRKLDNPHIIKVHDLFEENGTAYYVMDYVDGENLAERLKRTGKPMTETEVRELLPQILDALKTVHDAGIWHLDLKPANIMVDKSGNVKLIDFGASKQLNAQKGGATTSTAISYTNGYAPREQMEQNYDKFGPWTDIYALGATVYTMLTNKRPPLPTDIDDDATEYKNQSLPFPSSVNEDMKSLILWMMQTNRKQRPQDIDSVFHKLRQNNPSTIENDIDESTIIDKSKEKKEISYRRINRFKNAHLKYYIAALFAIIVCICVGTIYFGDFIKTDNNEDYKKPRYRVISENEKTCELYGSIPKAIERNDTNKGLSYSEYKELTAYRACIPRYVKGHYDIPSKVDGYTIIKLGDYSFCETHVSSVTIPEGVKTLGLATFSESYLSRISFPNSLISIGDSAFLGCTVLKSVSLGSIKEIGSEAFMYCDSLSTITIPEGVEEIPTRAFACCGSLSSIHLPSTLKRIKGRSFSDCNSISTIQIPDGVEEVWLSAFYYCPSLTSIRLPRTVHTIAGNFPDGRYLKTLISDIPDPFVVNYSDNTSIKGTFSPDCNYNYQKIEVLYIPKGSKELYVKAGWTKHFSKVIER